jgi:hypothetical protein
MLKMMAKLFSRILGNLMPSKAIIYLAILVIILSAIGGTYWFLRQSIKNEILIDSKERVIQRHEDRSRIDYDVRKMSPRDRCLANGGMPDDCSRL